MDAQVEYDLAPRVRNRLAQRAIHRLSNLLVVQSGERAALVEKAGPAVRERVVARSRRVARPVRLDEVDTPGCEGAGVLLIPAVASRNLFTIPVVARIQPEPELQSQRVNVGGNPRHAVVCAQRARWKEIRIDEELAGRHAETGCACRTCPPPVDNPAGRLYAERLMDELGFFDDLGDPAGRLFGGGGKGCQRRSARIRFRGWRCARRICRWVDTHQIVPAAVVHDVPVSVCLQA